MRTFFIAASILLVGTTLAVAAPGDSQSPYTQTVYELTLKDGSRVYGQVEGESDTEVVFRTTSGAALTTPRTRIVSLRPVVGRMIRGEFRRERNTGGEPLQRGSRFACQFRRFGLAVVLRRKRARGTGQDGHGQCDGDSQVLHSGSLGRVVATEQSPEPPMVSTDVRGCAAHSQAAEHGVATAAGGATIARHRTADSGASANVESGIQGCRRCAVPEPCTGA